MLIRNCRKTTDTLKAFHIYLLAIILWLGWHEIPFSSNDGDSSIMMTLTDGDPQTDADGVENGTIVDPGALALTSGGGSSSNSSGGGGGGGCFIKTAVGEFSWTDFFPSFLR